MTVEVAGLPALAWTHHPGEARLDADGALVLVAAAGVDWVNAATGDTADLGATALGFTPTGDFQLSARVGVAAPRTTFDAGVLTVWAGPGHYAKLCFEYSPDAEAMVVGVVTNTWSDDANGDVVDADSVYLRISRVGAAYAFHSSPDGRRWRFARVFRLHTDAPVTLGFLAQAPTGPSCTATFADVRFSPTTLTDLRDGS